VALGTTLMKLNGGGRETQEKDPKGYKNLSIRKRNHARKPVSQHI